MCQRAYLGKSSILELPSVLEQFVPKRILLVRGKKSYELCGAQVALSSIFVNLECQVLDFQDFKENPQSEDLDKGILLLEKYQPDLIIAIGGGSVIDMAKLMRFFYSYSGDKKKNIYQRKKPLIPLIAIPTTAGTGSEATHFAVLYMEKVKYSVAHKDVLPDIAIVDPQFTFNVPKYLSACTGFDALAQAIEAYWNVNATGESDEYAIKAVKLLWPNLELAVNAPTEDVREKISEGAYWAGRAINITKTTAPHAFSYPFTTYYGLPHGHAVALTFPFFFQLNLSGIDLKKEVDSMKYNSKMEILIEILDNKNIDWKNYLANIGLFSCKRMKDCKVSFLLDKVNIDRLTNNPVECTDEIRTELLKSLIN